MFNKQLFLALKNDPEFIRVANMFNPDIPDDKDPVFDFMKGMYEYSNEKFDANFNIDDTCQLSDVFFWNLIDKKYLEVEDFTRNEFEKFVTELQIEFFDVDDDNNRIYDGSAEYMLIKPTDFRKKSSFVHIISPILYYFFEQFYPILTPQRFDLFQRHCELLGIELPTVEHWQDYKAYMMYYYDVCMEIKKFQDEYEMTPGETCACIYYLASILEEGQEKTELPRPTNVWFTGAGKGDFEFLDKLESKSVWACNERTKRGDLIVIYCLSPRSYIHSIWRADSEGIFNPFDHYHCRTTVCDGVRVPQISIKDLKADEYFKKLPIVNKNLQGLNGVELSAQDYSELLRLIEKKSGDLTTMPKLMESSSVDFGEINLEKDVEEKILIPLLEELGYNENDWSRQLSQKAGRKEKAIPDFVFFPTGEKHFENAPFLIEAKLNMSSMIEQKKAYKQALSYSRMLKCSLFGICDKERLVLYSADKNGNFNEHLPVFESHWAVIYGESVVKANLNKLMGKEVVKKIK